MYSCQKYGLYGLLIISSFCADNGEVVNNQIYESSDVLGKHLAVFMNVGILATNIF